MSVIAGTERKLTKRQAKFVEAMVDPKVKTQTDAAIKAGYKPNSARSTASEYLTKPNIQQALTIAHQRIEERQDRQRKALLERVDDMHAEIDEVKAAFPDNPNVRLGIIGKIRDAADLEAKLTGAYIAPKDNPDSIKFIVNAVQAFYNNLIAYHRDNGIEMPGDEYIQGEVKRLCEPNGVDVVEVMGRLVRDE